MDVPVGHYAKLNRPDKEKQILYDLSYLQNLKKKKKKVKHIKSENEKWLPEAGEWVKWEDIGQRVQAIYHGDYS